MDAKTIEGLAEWSAPKSIQTRLGERLLRKAAPTQRFSELWKSEKKEELRTAGATFSKNNSTGEWELCWWLPISAQERQEREAALDESRAATSDAILPVPDGREYMPFQKAGIEYALKRSSTLIADEMGLGKTVEAIGVINADESIKQVLVICPASLKLNWRRELERWLVRMMPIQVVSATDTKLLPADILILNYDILHKHAAALALRQFDLAIVDECHFAKNKKSRRSKQTYAAAKVARRSIWMTGTPIVNRPSELLPILEAIGGDVMARTGGGFKYLRRYCNGQQTKWGWDFSGAAHLDELQRILRETCMVRRLKRDVLTELPAKRRQVVEFSANGNAGVVAREAAAVAEHQERIEVLKAAVKAAKESDNQEGYAAAVEALREGERVMFSEISRLRHETALAKIPEVLAHLETVIGEGESKVVLFAWHHDLIDQVAAALGDAAVVLTGDTPLVARQAAVDRFQTDPTCQVFIGSITAAGVGLTLTASSHVIFAELDWVPGNMSQAEDRCHRIGQTQSVLVQHLVLEGSLDATMARTLIAKQEVIDKALDRKLEPITEAESHQVFEAAAADHAKAERSRKLEEISGKLTADHIQAIHKGLRLLAGQCDGASSRDDHGFSKLDAEIGHSLAEAPALSPKQAALGLKVLTRYKNTQVPEDVCSVLANIW